MPYERESRLEFGLQQEEFDKLRILLD